MPYKQRFPVVVFGLVTILCASAVNAKEAVACTDATAYVSGDETTLRLKFSAPAKVLGLAASQFTLDGHKLAIPMSPPLFTDFVGGKAQLNVNAKDVTISAASQLLVTAHIYEVPPGARPQRFSFRRGEERVVALDKDGSGVMCAFGISPSDALMTRWREFCKRTKTNDDLGAALFFSLFAKSASPRDLYLIFNNLGGSIHGYRLVDEKGGLVNSEVRMTSSGGRKLELKSEYPRVFLEVYTQVETRTYEQVFKIRPQRASVGEIRWDGAGPHGQHPDAR